MVDCLKSPEAPRSKGEWIAGEIRQQSHIFPVLLPRHSGLSVESAQLGYNLKDFLVVRRDTSGALSTIEFYEMNSGIPDVIREHPIVCELDTLAVDLIVIANGILSYNKEQAIGDDGHMITNLMNQNHLYAWRAV